MCSCVNWIGEKSGGKKLFRYYLRYYWMILENSKTLKIFFSKEFSRNDSSTKLYILKYILKFPPREYGTNMTRETLRKRADIETNPISIFPGQTMYPINNTIHFYASLLTNLIHFQWILLLREKGTTIRTIMLHHRIRINETKKKNSLNGYRIIRRIDQKKSFLRIFFRINSCWIWIWNEFVPSSLINN